MNRGPLIVLGAFAALFASFLGLVLAAQRQVGAQQAVTTETGQLYPVNSPGMANQGREVYRANGCYYCHTQQVRRWGETPDEAGAEIQRGWGRRHSVARDYLYQNPVMLGALRMGPDLTNVGVRQTNEVWQLIHLYNPKIITPKSIMPGYPHLFEKRRVRGQGASDALPLTGEYAPEPGYEIVPTGDAKALANYLVNLQSDTEFFPEASWPKESSPAPGANAAPTEGAQTP